jgi:hypothetical protein
MRCAADVPAPTPASRAARDRRGPRASVAVVAAVALVGTAALLIGPAPPRPSGGRVGALDLLDARQDNALVATTPRHDRTPAERRSMTVRSPIALVLAPETSTCTGVDPRDDGARRAGLARGRRGRPGRRVHQEFRIEIGCDRGALGSRRCGSRARSSWLA